MDGRHHSVAGSTAGELLDVACREDEFWVATAGNTLAGTFVRYSADRGATWRDALPVQIDTAIAGISAPAAALAVAVGVDSSHRPMILRTEDAGITWARQPIDGIADEGALADVTFAGPSEGTAVGGLGGFSLDPVPLGSLTTVSPAADGPWVAGESVEGFVWLVDVARIPQGAGSGARSSD